MLRYHRDEMILELEEAPHDVKDVVLLMDLACDGMEGDK